MPSNVFSKRSILQIASYLLMISFGTFESELEPMKINILNYLFISDVKRF